MLLLLRMQLRPHLLRLLLRRVRSHLRLGILNLEALVLSLCLPCLGAPKYQVRMRTCIRTRRLLGEAGGGAQ